MRRKPKPVDEEEFYDDPLEEELSPYHKVWFAIYSDFMGDLTIKELGLFDCPSDPLYAIPKMKPEPLYVFDEDGLCDFISRIFAMLNEEPEHKVS